MIDLAFIRQHPDVVKKAARDKKVPVDVDHTLTLDQARRDLQGKISALEHERNTLAKQSSQGKPSAQTIERGKQLKIKLADLTTRFKQIDTELAEALAHIPNIPTDDTPIGAAESDNTVLRTVGTPRSFDFTPKTHWELGQAHDILDNQRAAKVTGSRFTYLKGEAALLEFALVNFVLGIVTNQEKLSAIIQQAGLSISSRPFIPVIPPVLIRPEVFHKMDRLEPKDERYYIPSDNQYLIGSAEHTLGAMHMDEQFSEDQMPVRYVGFSTAFRREAGSYGKDIHGIIRLHQFDKLELESFSLPAQSRVEHDFFVAIQEYIVQALELPYQVVLKCTADMGKPNARAVDIETWLPGENRYRETHTADFMTDYQARRLHTKIKRADGTSVYAHMNDGTAVAIGRMLVAILENHQRADGSIAIPPALHPCLSFTTI